MNLVELLVGAVFALWLACTVAFQCPPLQLRMRLRDPFYVLPSWSFFAPTPNTSDYAFYVRYEKHGTLTPWRRLELHALRQFGPIWDPDRRRRKVVIDISQNLAELARAEQPERLQYTTPYLLLLQLASTRPEALFATGVQAAIGVRPSTSDVFHLFFQTYVHRIDAAVGRLDVPVGL